MTPEFPLQAKGDGITDDSGHEIVVETTRRIIASWDTPAAYNPDDVHDHTHNGDDDDD